MDNRDQTEVWEIAIPSGAGGSGHGYMHPTQKPVELPARAIKNSSMRGAIVLDMFAGSGSTLIACEELNRTCYMVEIDPNFCDVIIARWEKHTGKKAKKIQ